MWTTKEVHLVEFYKRSLQAAAHGGYKILLCLVARRADAPQLFASIKEEWQSFHDLTGPDIMFLFAGEKVRHDLHGSGLLRRGNYEDVIFSENAAIAAQFKDYRDLKFDGPPDKRRHLMRITHPYSLETLLDAREEPDTPPSFTQHSLETSKLRDHLNLKERDLPCLHFTFIEESEQYAVKVLDGFPLYQFMKELRSILDESPYYSPDAGAQDQVLQVAQLNEAIAIKTSMLARLDDSASLRLTRYLDELRALSEETAHYSDAARIVRELFIQHAFHPTHDFGQCHKALTRLESQIGLPRGREFGNDGRRLIQAFRNRRFAGMDLDGLTRDVADQALKRQRISNLLHEQRREFADSAESLDQLRSMFFGGIDELLHRFGAFDLTVPKRPVPSGDFVFISYDRRDIVIAQQLVGALRRRSIEVWWDNDIAVGERFRHFIRRAIESSKAVIVIWSKYSIDSEWVNAEARLARGLKRLIPVTTADIGFEHLPLPFGELNLGTIEDVDSIEKAIKSIENTSAFGTNSFLEAKRV
jgi:hypothetical protein